MSELVEGAVVDGKYRVQRKLSEGGMGAVFVAEHVFLRKRVALKLLHPELASQPDAAERFAREARAASLVEHENVVRCSDFGRTPEGKLYLVMELLDGQTLAAELEQQRRLSPTRARFIGCEILRGLEAAHARGVVHRDLKPDNVFVVPRPGSDDAIKLVDFGIARLRDESAGQRRLTRSGAIMGTPLYMAPEQVRGQKDVDPRADLYAVAVMMYEMLAGKPPFDGASFGQIAHAILEGKPAPLSQVAEIDPVLSALVMKGLAADRDRRFASAAEMREALERHRPDEPLADEPSPYVAPRASQLQPLRDPDAGTMRARPARDGDALSETLDGQRRPEASSERAFEKSAATKPPALDEQSFLDAEPVALELDRSTPPAAAPPPPRKAPIGLLAVVAAVVVAVAGAAIWMQRSTATTTPPPPDRVQVRITDLPRGAKVYVDNVPSEPTFTIGGSHQTHRLRLTAIGYADKALLFTPDSDLTIDGRMTRSR